LLIVKERGDQLANKNTPLKRLLLTFPLMLSIMIALTLPSHALSSSEIVGESAIVMDYDSGEILFSKNPDKKMYPASTTKIMTALLSIEALELDTNVVIDDETPFTEGSRIYLFADEIISIKDLLHALLLESANDAAVALAKAVSGDVENFVDLMNSRAKEIGAINTNFANPNGLPDKSHVTTVRDMALIARQAYENDVFKEIVHTVNYIIDPSEKQPESRYLKNGNRFLWGRGSGNQIYYDGNWIDIKYPIVDGIKTGYTIAAQQCLVTTASKGGRRVITVVFKSRQKNIYTDSRKLIDFGLDSFENINLSNKGERLITADISGGKEKTLEVVSGENLIHTLPAGTPPDAVKSEIHINENLNAPVVKGDLVGKVTYSIDEKLIGTIPLMAEKTIPEKTWKDTLSKLAERINWLASISVLLFIYIARRTYVTVKRLKRIKERKQKNKNSR